MQDAAHVPFEISSARHEVRTRVCELLREMDALQASLKAVFSRWNMTTPIAVLPTEILATIFQLFVNNAIANDSRRPYTWLNITHVCRAWRDVAIHTVSLWTWIAFTHLKFDYDALVPLFLLRAKKAPLSLTVMQNASIDNLPDFFIDPSIDPSIYPRVEAYDLGRAPCVEKLLEYSNTHCSNVLTSLKLQPAEKEINEQVTFGSPFPFPSLRILRLANVPGVMATGIACPNLRALDLLGLKHPQLSLAQLVKISTSIPLLEDLAMSSDIGYLDEAVQSHTIRPVLSRLRRLDASIDASGLAALLTLTTIPRDAIRLIDIYNDVPPSQALQLLGALDANLGQHQSPLQTDACSLVLHRGIVGLCWAGAVMHYDTLHDRHPFPLSKWQDHFTIHTRFSVGMGNNLDLGLDVALTQDLCRVMRTQIQLPQMKILRLSMAPSTLTESWLQLFSEMVNVEELHLDEALLAPDILRYTPQRAHTISSTLFPRLICLTIVSPTITLLDTLLPALKERLELGEAYPLEELCVQGFPGNSTGLASRLKAVISKVSFTEYFPSPRLGV